ncbi:hypothetical protein CYMTET_32636, partial [Cymbomonas tetramitiformis]
MMVQARESMVREVARTLLEAVAVVRRWRGLCWSGGEEREDSVGAVVRSGKDSVGGGERGYGGEEVAGDSVGAVVGGGKDSLLGPTGGEGGPGNLGFFLGGVPDGFTREFGQK